MSDLLFRPASELAGLVRSGELSARELVQASLDRIEALDPELNAFVDVFADDALAAADEVRAGDERPFAGVPIAIKNNRAIDGKRLTFAAEFFGDWEAPYDHNVVRRLKEAGFVVMGSTTLPEWGILPWTNTKRFGPTRNPWDPARTSGGSSGGSATAVASGMVPIAHANDGGGSTRIPAACCGLVGLKPQRNRISLAPDTGESFLAIDGVLTHTVQDTALVLDVLAGTEIGDASWAPPPPEPFAATAAREPAAPARGRGHQPAHRRAARPGARGGRARRRPRCSSPSATTSRRHRRRGARTRCCRPSPRSSPRSSRVQIAFGRLVHGREPTEEEMEPLSWALWQLVRGMSALDTHLASAQLQIFARGLVTWMDQYDVIVAPALAEAPVLLDDVDWRTDDPMGLFTRSGAFTPFTAVANVTGQPAIALPLAEHEGLPVGVQLFGRPAREGDLLAVATQLEAARPWAQRRPAL